MTPQVADPRGVAAPIDTFTPISIGVGSIAAINIARAFAFLSLRREPTDRAWGE